ncbi:MAG: hypothetical protein U0359_38430 [Byssovorax sp.]
MSGLIRRSLPSSRRAQSEHGPVAPPQARWVNLDPGLWESIWMICSSFPTPTKTANASPAATAYFRAPRGSAATACAGPSSSGSGHMPMLCVPGRIM